VLILAEGTPRTKTAGPSRSLTIHWPSGYCLRVSFLIVGWAPGLFVRVRVLMYIKHIESKQAYQIPVNDMYQAHRVLVLKLSIVLISLGARQLSPPDYRGAAAALLYQYISLGTAKVFPRRVFYPYGWWEQGAWSSGGEGRGGMVKTGGRGKERFVGMRSCPVGAQDESSAGLVEYKKGLSRILFRLQRSHAISPLAIPLVGHVYV
jgi:hypothetical protein